MRPFFSIIPVRRPGLALLFTASLLVLSCGWGRGNDGPRLYKALNLNGPALEIGGVNWEASGSVPDFETPDRGFENQSVPLRPEAESSLARLLRSSFYHPKGQNRVTLKDVPAGDYQVTLYTWEDNAAQTFDVFLNGEAVLRGHESGPGGAWHRLGPWPVHLTGTGRIEITTRGGHANLSGLAVWNGEAEVPPVVRPERPTRPPRLATLTGTDHWSFGTPGHPAVPVVRATGRVRTPVDAFILATLEARGLVPAGEADRRTLIRRLTYDLTGLPPSPEAVVAFEGDTRPDAYDRLVDRLLESPQYGERWGRHWLDVVRYADTAGDNSDYPVPQLWRYRNYVIDAFNTDKPYNQFVREQIAGDLLPAADRDQRNEQIIATSYIALSRRFGSLFEGYPQHLTIEDTIDNLGRTFLGLSLNCARCHDHKFDPISIQDYYGLYGIFNSTTYAFPGIELQKVPKDLVPLVDDARAEALLRPYRERIAPLDRELEALETEKRAFDDKEPGAPEEERADLRRRIEQLKGRIKKLRNQREELARHKPDLPMAYAVSEGRPQDVRVQLMGEPSRPGMAVPRAFPEVLGGQVLDDAHAASSGRRQLADWIVDPENPLTARVFVNRVWQWHFGRGLVGTPSDFGNRGEAPSHPELLDWLADQFVKEGWSVKTLHRWIVRSGTYRQASTGGTGTEVDPDNRWLWRQNPRKLDAESLRDTLLEISGRLDRSAANEPHPFPPSEKWEYTQHHPFKDEYETQRRSVYMMTKRLTRLPFFAIFDGPDRNASTPVRSVSTTAVQALFLMNDAFLHESARALAARVGRERTDDSQRVDRLHLLAYARPATVEEIKLGREFLAAARETLAATGMAPHRVDAEAWSSYARVLLRANEFTHID